MTSYRSAKDLQSDVEDLLGHEVDGVTVNHRTGDVAIEGVTDSELDRVRRDVDPRADASAAFRRGPPENRGGSGDG